MKHLVVSMLIIFLLAPTGAWSRNKLSPEERDWLKMVDFIITSKERRIFRRKLADSYERQKFIDLFWAKRDPDLTDATNPFKDRWLARYDYVMTQYEYGKNKIPRDERSYIYLMLGKPDRIEPRVDITIMGPRFRNQYLQHQPELWQYDSVGYGYQRVKLKVQMVPTSTFGDFVAITDNFTINWIRNLKFKFIVNPDLEFAPLPGSSTETFREVVDLSPPAGPEGEIPVPVTAPPQTEPSPSDKPGLTAADRIEAEVDAELAGETRPLPAAKAETSLSVPAPVTTVEDQSQVKFAVNAGNPLGVDARMGFFRGGPDRALLLTRLGFPLAGLDYQFKDGQYHAPFSLEYQLIDRGGRVMTTELIDSNISLPDLDKVTAKDAWYTREFAVLLPEDRYRLMVQVRVADGPVSFHQAQIDIPPLVPGLWVTQLALMDPNVDARNAKFSVAAKSMGFAMKTVYTESDKLYPVIEILSQPDPEILDSVQMHAIRDEQTVKTWVMYPEEMQDTGLGTIMVHPELLLRGLEPGNYRLRFEMELPTGDLLLSETDFNIE